MYTVLISVVLYIDMCDQSRETLIVIFDIFDIIWMSMCVYDIFFIYMIIISR